MFLNCLQSHRKQNSNPEWSGNARRGRRVGRRFYFYGLFPRDGYNCGMKSSAIRTGYLSVLPVFLFLLLCGCASQREPAISPTAAKPDSPAIAATSSPKPAKSVPTAENKDWRTLFDGQTLKGWAITDFGGHGDVKVSDGRIILGNGVMTGVTWTSDIPRMNYEVELEAMRVDGSDFFCGLTFPVGKDPCSLIVGGWGGSLVGLSSLDGEDASSNETTKFMNFENGRWYKIRLVVKSNKIQAWIDDEKLVDAVTTDRKISIRFEVELSVPFGIATYSTTGALRNIRVREL